MAPYVTLYNRLINTLTDNAHLTLNNDLYIYTYDWRQPLDKQAENFKKFINQLLVTKIPGTKFRLVGHSLGGLVIRSYLENNSSDNHILSALTIGTPHFGAVDVYPIWEKGIIVQKDMTAQIAIDQVINHCRIIRTFIPPKKYVPILKLKSAKEVIQYLVPVIRQLLPTFDYLKLNGQIKETSKLLNQNDWLSANPVPENKYNITLNTLSGENKQTTRYINVTNPSIREKVFGEWADGKPTSYEYTTYGDGTILTQSSQIDGANNEKISATHAEIVYSDIGIRKILEFLGYQDIPVAADAIPTEEKSIEAITVSTDEETSIKIEDPTGTKLVGQKNILVDFDTKAGLYQLEVEAKKNTVALLHLSYVKTGNEAQNTNYNLYFYENRPKKFYLIYNPKNSQTLNLIPL